MTSPLSPRSREVSIGELFSHRQQNQQVQHEKHQTIHQERYRQKILQQDLELAEKTERARRNNQKLRADLQRIKGGLADIKSLSEAAISVPCIPRVNMQVRQTLRGHLAKIYCMDWSTDRRHLVSASQDGKMIVWDAYTNQKLLAIPLPSSWVLSCAYSASGNLIASGGLDNIVSVFNVSSAGIYDGPIENNNNNNTGLFQNELKKPGQVAYELAGHSGYISCCRFLSDRKMLTGSGDKTCGLWDIQSARQIRTFVDHLGDVMSISVSPTNPNIFVSGSCDQTCKVWDTRISQTCQTFEGANDDINHVQFYGDGNAILAGSEDSTCRLFDLRNDRQIALYANNSVKSPVMTTCMSPSSRLLFIGHDDGLCRIWDSLKEENVGILAGHNKRITSMGFSNDGISLCTASWDATIKIWTP